MFTEQQLFEQLARLESEKLKNSDDISQLKKDTKLSEDNPSGLSAEQIKVVAAAAKLYAKKDFFEKKEAAEAVFKKYVELSGEDE